MERPQVSLRKLMFVVLAVGFGLAALSHPNVGWSTVWSGFYLTLILTAVTGALVQSGRRRAFWVGFAVFSFAYLVPAFVGHEFLTKPGVIGERIITLPFYGALELLLVLVTGNREEIARIPVALGQVDKDDSITVAYTILGVLFASLGGLIGRSLARDETT